MADNKELFKVVETFNVEGFGIVERVEGDVSDITMVVDGVLKTSCNRCCFNTIKCDKFKRDGKPFVPCNECRKRIMFRINSITNNYITDFYRRKTSECITNK